MPAALRLTLWVTFAALWVSGCVWLALHLGFEQQTEFGPIPNPWEAPVIRLHGWFAVAGVFLLGWIAGSHVLDRWTARRNRNSGLILAGTAVVIVISGYALYYTTDRLHSGAADVHEVLGGAAILFALLHWRRRAARTAPSNRRARTHHARAPLSVASAKHKTHQETGPAANDG